MLQIVCEAWTHFDSKNKIQASKSILKLAKITYIVLLTMMQIFHQQRISHRLWLAKNEHPSWQQCKIFSLQLPDTRLHNTKVIYCVPAKIFSIRANSFLFHRNVNFVMMHTCNFSQRSQRTSDNPTMARQIIVQMFSSWQTFGLFSCSW